MRRSGSQTHEYRPHRFRRLAISKMSRHRATCASMTPNRSATPRTAMSPRITARTEVSQYFAGVGLVEEVNGGGIDFLQEPHLQLPHETGRGHPKIVPHHDNALQATAVALTQRVEKLAGICSIVGVKPLLELIEHEQNFSIGAGCGQS